MNLNSFLPIIYASVWVLATSIQLEYSGFLPCSGSMKCVPWDSPVFTIIVISHVRLAPGPTGLLNPRCHSALGPTVAKWQFSHIILTRLRRMIS